MPIKITNEIFIDRLYNINPKIKPLEEYKKSNQKILVRCNVCNHEWQVAPASLLQGTGCPCCADKNRNRNTRKTHEQFVKELKAINPNIEVLSKYQRNNIKISLRCKICNHEWKASPDKLLIGRGCPICARLKIHNDRSWTQEQFEKELFKINPQIKVLGQYYNARTKILVKCLNCGHEWETTPYPLLKKGVGCPSCVSSKGEMRIKKFLDRHNIHNISSKSFSDCVHIRALKFDFYLPEYNMCIEYDGKQHFQPVEYFGGMKNFQESQIRDQIKNEYCKTNNIILLRIPYTEFNNIEFILQDQLHIN